ncbi:probable WRKY transcription factor 10 [Raphanus sativus]|uniref:Probable WRKY transcription factor 10 n=1 Tax=Raphanus sativus TaxID=3726 RepID=A0A6J0N540_RAPSA|nr:probable WRKY transcription factor 10 [Raphanus sativus]
MSDYSDGNFMDMVSHWTSLPSPILGEIVAMPDQTDNGLNPISNTFLPTNQSEKKTSLVERVSTRVGRNIPPLRIENLRPSALFKNKKTVLGVNEISPGLSPSVMLQSPSQLISPFSFPNDWPPETVENPGDDHAATMIFNNNVPYQPMHFDLPPQEVTGNSAYIPSHESQVDPIGAPLVASFESELADDPDFSKLLSFPLDDESESQEDDDIAGELEIKPSSPKRRKYEASDMITAGITSKDPSVIIRMETEEDQPCDGYRWRKYGQKIVKANPNPRSYYICSYSGCNVKKHVERAADDVKILVVSYNGRHVHPEPGPRSSSSSGPKNRPRSSVAARLGRPPFSSSSAARDKRPLATQNMRPFAYPSASATQDMRPFPSSLNSGVDMTHLYKTGLSKMPSLPVNQTHGLMGQNAEPWINQNHGLMGQNAEPWVNQNHGFMDQNAEPWVNQNHGFMGDNVEPCINQNHGLMGQNDKPKTDHVIPDGTEVYKWIMERLLANFGVKH